MENKNMNCIERVGIRLVREGVIEYGASIINACDVKKAVAEYLKDFDREVFGIINLTGQGQVINFSVVSVGTLNASLVHMREVFKSAILSNAAAIVAFHNHPGGSLKASSEDIECWEKLKSAGEILGIKAVDSVIVSCTTGDYLSIASERG